jgi:arylsulfatase A-like enzyme
MTRPNVLWITIESTRADHTFLGDYEYDTMANVEQVANAPRGRGFEQAFSQGIWTLASSASIVTGTYPSHHGVGMVHDLLTEDFRTVPERLGAVGYRSGIIAPHSQMSPVTDLCRGFDDIAYLNSDTLVETAGWQTLLKYALNYRRHGAGFTTDTQRIGTGYIINDIAKRWLRSYQRDSDPFFLYTFYGDPHHLYYPPTKELETFADAFDMSIEEAREASLHHSHDLHENIANGCDFTEDQWNAIKALYDGEIAYTDHQIRDLLTWMAKRGLLEDTIVVITADHGECFGEDGMLAHMVTVNDAVCHVPMVVYGFDEILDYDGMVQHTDVMGTILDHVGADTEGMQGIDMRTESRNYAVIQRGWNRAKKNIDRFKELNPAFDDSPYHHADLTAVRTPEFKYLVSDDRTELFELPDEETDVSAAYPEDAQRLDGIYTRWMETAGQPGYADAEPRQAEYSDAMKRQLADLGYLVD